MSEAAAARAPLEFGRVWALTGRMLRHLAVPLLVMGLLLFAIPNIIFSALLSMALPPLMNASYSDFESALFTARAIGIGRLAFPLFTLYLLQAGVLRHVFATREGRKASLGDSLLFALRRAGTAVGLALVIFLCVAAGTLLLVVPGVLIWTSWSMALPLAVQEGAGLNDSLNRSGALVRGNRGPVFAVSLVLFLGLLAAEVVVRVGGVMWLAPTFNLVLGDMVLPMAIAVLAVETFAAVAFAAAFTATYIQLRGLDADSDATAEVFV